MSSLWLGAVVLFLMGCTPTPSVVTVTPLSITPPAPTPMPVLSPVEGKEGIPLPPNPAIVAQAPLTLEVWFAADYYGDPPIVDLAREFEQAYPNVTVRLSGYEWGEMRDRVRAAVEAGTPPDVVHQHAFALGAQGFAEPLDDLWAAWAAEPQFMPGAMEDVLWKGRRYGVPLDINCLFTLYNKALFRAAGVPEPTAGWTYEDLLQIAARLTRPDGTVKGLAVSASAWYTFGHVRSNGGDLLRVEEGQVHATLDTPQNVEMVQFLADLVSQYGYSPPPLTGGRYDPVELFFNGKVALFFTGPWDLKRIEREGPPGVIADVGTVELPRGFRGDTDSSVQGGGSLLVPRGSQHREVAFEFMKWAASPHYQMRLAREMGRYPVIAALYDDPFFREQALLQPFFAQLRTARPYKLEAYLNADRAWEDAVAAIIVQGADAAETLRQANARAQAAIDAAEGK